MIKVKIPYNIKAFEKIKKKIIYTENMCNKNCAFLAADFYCSLFDDFLSKPDGIPYRTNHCISFINNKINAFKQMGSNMRLYESSNACNYDCAYFIPMQCGLFKKPINAQRRLTVCTNLFTPSYI